MLCVDGSHINDRLLLSSCTPTWHSGFPPNYGVAEIGRNLENDRERVIVLLFDTFSCQGYKRESGTIQNDCRAPGI